MGRKRTKTDPVAEPVVATPPVPVASPEPSKPQPDAIHAEKIRSTILTNSAKVLASMRQAGIYPKSTVGDRQFVSDITKAEPTLDGGDRTCLSVLLGSYYVFLIKQEESSLFDQDHHEYVFDLGSGVFIAIVLT